MPKMNQIEIIQIERGSKKALRQTIKRKLKLKNKKTFSSVSDKTKCITIRKTDEVSNPSKWIELFIALPMHFK